MKIITEKGKVVSLSFKNLTKKSFSLKGLFNKAKKIVSNIGETIKKYAVMGVDKIVERIHKKIDDFERWLYIKLDEKFREVVEIIPEEVIEIVEEIIE